MHFYEVVPDGFSEYQCLFPTFMSFFLQGEQSKVVHSHFLEEGTDNWRNEAVVLALKQFKGTDDDGAAAAGAAAGGNGSGSVSDGQSFSQGESSSVMMLCRFIFNQ